jgi:hypothetical protein
MNFRARRIPAVLSSLAIVVALGSSATPAFAGDVTAEMLYQEGRRAAQSHDWTLACKKFRESQDREPAPGTLLNLADCEENRGELTLAIAHFEAAAALFRDNRATYAKERAGALEKRLPRVTMRLPPSAPKGATVELDGRPLGASVLGTPVPLDPGDHTWIVRAPGSAEVKISVRLQQGETREVTLGVDDPNRSSTAGAPGAPTAEPRLTAVPLAGSQAPTDSTGEQNGTLKTAGFVGFGVGALGLGLGIVGTAMTATAKADADRNCEPRGCNDEGLAAQSRGKTASALATGGMVVAGIGAVTGALLVFVVPSLSKARVGSVRAAPIVGASMVGLQGEF